MSKLKIFESCKSLCSNFRTFNSNFFLYVCKLTVNFVATDDKESVVRVLRRIDTIKQTIARNRVGKEIKSPAPVAKEKSPVAIVRRHDSPAKCMLPLYLNFGSRVG
jgi:hypothetical protein